MFAKTWEKITDTFESVFGCNTVANPHIPREIQGFDRKVIKAVMEKDYTTPGAIAEELDEPEEEVQKACSRLFSQGAITIMDKHDPRNNEEVVLENGEIGIVRQRMNDKVLVEVDGRASVVPSESVIRLCKSLVIGFDNRTDKKISVRYAEACGLDIDDIDLESETHEKNIVVENTDFGPMIGMTDEEADLDGSEYPEQWKAYIRYHKPDKSEYEHPLGPIVEAENKREEELEAQANRYVENKIDESNGHKLGSEYKEKDGFEECPFCDGDDVMLEVKNEKRSRGACTNCGATGSWARYEYHPTAVELWNQWREE